MSTTERGQWYETPDHAGEVWVPDSVATPFAAPVDVHAYCERARSTPALLEKARATFALVAPSLFAERPKRTTITASDAGACALSLWALLHDKLDIPDAEFVSRDKGTLVGAWHACLLKAAIEDAHPDVECEAEPTILWGDVPGHADFAVYARAGGNTTKRAYLWVVDWKTTAVFAPIAPHLAGKTVPSNEHQVWQTALYALALGAPICTVQVVGGAAETQADYDVASWKDAVTTEIARLRTAEAAKPPPADPRRDYLCKSCRYSACEQNVNPRRPAEDVPLDLSAWVATVGAK